MKKWLALLLACCLLVPFLTACPGGETPGTGGGGDDTEGEYLDSLGEFDFGGEEFTVSCFSLFEYEIYAEEGSGEVLDDAIYKRNRKLENRFHVKIVPDVTVATGVNDLESHYAYVQRCMNSSEGPFDAIAMYAYQSGKLIMTGQYYDWRSEIPYCSDSIKAGAEWWPEAINLDSTVNGYQFVAISDLCITSMEMCYTVLFNKNIAEENNVAQGVGVPGTYQTLYEIVDAGAWTYDVMYGIVKDFWQDSATGGTQNQRDEEDVYGLVVGGGTDADAWAFAFNYKYLANDGVMTPDLWSWNVGIVNAISDLRALYTATGTYKNWGDDYTQRTTFFANDHALFNLTTLLELKTDIIHTMESLYGVLPYPKRDANQTAYHTGTLDHYTVLSVPTFVMGEDLERTGVMIEALSAETTNSVVEPYYNLIVTHKNTTDAESVRMIELIMAGRLYDLTTYHYDDIKFASAATDNSSYGLFFRYLISTAPAADIASFWEANRSSLQAQLDDLIAEYETIVPSGAAF